MQFSGTVGKGRGFGTTIGFPTANIPLTDISVSGIYAATLAVDGKEYLAAAYADQKRHLLEAHVLDFKADLYGKSVTITLGAKVREDATFDTREALAAQIQEDIRVIRTRAHGPERTI